MFGTSNTGADTSAGAGSNFDVGSLGGADGSAGEGGAFTGVGYIDSAIPLTQYRLRVDSANGNNEPDRADFFYEGGPNGPGSAVGPGSAAKNVDFTELSNYLEIAFHPRFSAFINVPFRWVDITFLDQSMQVNRGLSDIQFGFKAALIYEPSRVLTFQMRTYSPTGKASLGLGRGDWNLEPGLLFYQRLAPRLFFEGEIEDFIPFTVHDDFAGIVLTYAGGLSYLFYNTPQFRIAPVTELVGWTVLNGQESAGNMAVSAAGNTIVNAFFSVRIGFGELVQPGFVNRADVYVGYGRALTGDVWYKNLFRVEFRLRF
ncbi:MAG TPA: hypothetical protein VH643_23630 [Gemmataceae bacterium]|jgi:hypothetical protein